MFLSELAFGCGTVVFVEGAFVRPAYCGLMLGAPGDETNEDMIKTRIAEAQRALPWQSCFLVKPNCFPDERGRPCLPEFCCAAHLLHYDPAHDRTRMMSSATLVWFQRSFEPVIGEQIREWAKSSRWADVAVDGDW